jgi:hypothetical protein
VALHLALVYLEGVDQKLEPDGVRPCNLQRRKGMLDGVMVIRNWAVALRCWRSQRRTTVMAKRQTALVGRTVDRAE